MTAGPKTSTERAPLQIDYNPDSKSEQKRRDRNCMFSLCHGRILKKVNIRPLFLGLQFESNIEISDHLFKRDSVQIWLEIASPMSLLSE